MEWIADRLGVAPGIATKLVVTTAVVVALVVARALVGRAIARRAGEDLELLYRARKASTYVAVIVGAVVLIAVWFEALGNLGTFLGLATAGVAIALSDLLKNVAGWLYIITRRPFRVDDRVEMAGHVGDVIDIRVFRFSILEVGHWVDAEQSTGRIIHIPNGRVLTEPVANATEGFGYVSHEVPVLITFESDWRRAEELLLDVVRRTAPDVTAQAAAEIRRAAHAYKIRYRHLDPAVYVTVRDSGVLLTARVLVETRTRRAVEQAIWRGVLDALAAEPRVELAYPTIRTYLADPIRLASPPPAAAGLEEGPSSPPPGVAGPPRAPSEP